ncbi:MULTISPECIES: hypothetical protein [unclassified Nostoc]|uniref:hypothetical protein n=1 Tax=unclassified Nostoc TaxID=2593658 RepID=UPI00262D2BD6|nr:hypothetical protein [Nostoc sp. S13]MDF5735825.1 hypothetical protein [Nostoc sp. S13]
MKNTKAIVTLAIGKHYFKRWQKLCAENWSKYAINHGYDIICIDTPLDDSPRAQSRSPAWQKCLILGDERVKKYTQVVWIDSDILINPNSPCVVSNVPEDKVGAVDMFIGPLCEAFSGEFGRKELLVDRSVEFWKWSFRTAKEFYSISKFTPVFDCVVQTGVMVLSPNYHHEILKYTYYTYENHVGQHYEMESLSYELVTAGLLHWLDCKFNRLWIECMLRDYPFLLPSPTPENKILRTWKRLTRGHSQRPARNITRYCLSSAFINNYFLHFAGTSQYMSWFETNIVTWRYLRGKF